MRRFLLLLPLALALVLFGAYVLVDTWLESAGGRRAVEKKLEERTGLPVRLEGEFAVMLLPTLGVSGTELAVGGSGPSDEILRSGEYALSLALGALLEGRVVIEAIRLDSGSFQLERWLELDEEPGDPTAPPVSLPEVRLLELRGFRVAPGEGAEPSYLLQELRIDAFTEGGDTPFRLVVADFGAWAGRFSWSSRAAQLELQATGSGAWPGTIRLGVEARLDSNSGSLDALWVGDPVAAAPRPDVHLSLGYAVRDGGARLDGLQLDIDTLSVRGDGCLWTRDPAALHLELVADRVDLDALPGLDAFTGNRGAERAAWEPPVDLNVRLSAAEILKGGAVAQQAVLRVGSDPDCRDLDAAPTGDAGDRPTPLGMRDVAQPIQ